ncbi:MAG: TolC family protein [Armatimonadetes bacterium]|nr:TolC family protein [Armatimonadota bacterium]
MTYANTKKTGAALVAALLLSIAPAALHAQAGAAGAGGAAGAANGGTGAPGNAGTTGNGTATGTTGTAASGATGGTAAGTTGNNGAAAPGATGANGTNGAGGTTGTSGVNGTTGTGTGGALSNGAAPGGSVPQTGNPAPVRYNVAQTVADALKSSADVQTATRNIEIDRRRADEAAAQGRPNVNARGQATRYDQATRISIGGSPPIEVLPSHTELLQLNLVDQLDIAGQIRAASDQYRLQSLADQFLLQQVSNARILRGRTIYFNLLRAQHQVQVARASLQNAQQQQKDALSLYRAGTGQRIDLLRANTQVAQAQQQLIQAQNNAGVAQSSFNDLVGRPLATPIVVEDVPGVTVGQPVTNTGAVGAPSPEATFTPYTVAPGEVGGIDLNRSLDTAFASRPEILADQVNVRVAETGITLARAGLEPTLTVDAAGDYFPTTSFQNPRQRTAEVTGTLTIPLYDAGATRDRVQEARLRRENAQTTLESQRSDVALDVRQAYLNLVTAANQIDAANTALEQAVAARQLAEIRYRGGVGLFLEVTDAQAALVQAENSQVNAVYDYLVARAQFQNAIGRPQTQ